MLRGTVLFFDESKGFGKISAEDGREIFVHCTGIEGPGAQILIEGEAVEFDCEERDRGPQAFRVRRLAERVLGTVDSFDDRKGYGRLKRDDNGDLVFAHFSDILGTGFKSLEAKQPVEFTPVDTPKGPKATNIKVLDSRPPLERFAVISDLEQHLADLAQMAQKENWDYRHSTSKRPYPILRSYLYYTFARLEEEDKIAQAKDDNGRPVACFNTGLVTDRQESIYALFLPEKKPGPKTTEWYLSGFHRESDHQLSHFPKPPDLANYFSDPAELLYDPRIELRVDVDHVIGDNRTRFPEPLRDNEYALRSVLDGTIAAAKRRIRRNYKTAVPQFHRGQLQLLLPLCLLRPEQADLALVVARAGQVYRGSTVLTLDMAYNNARLIARPDTEWLDP